MNKVSVIIPNYNNSKYLRQCVESVINQTYKNIEIIIVDDCSTDGSKEIIRELEIEFPQVKGIFCKANGGVSKARNMGFSLSTGQIVTFLDSDDFYFNGDKIKNEVFLLEKEIKTIVFSYVQNVDENGNPIEQIRKNYSQGDVFFEWMKGKNSISYPRDYCMLRDTFKNSGLYEESCSFYEDLDLLFRLSLNNIFLCTREIGTAYRKTDSGLSQKPGIEHKKTTRTIRKKYLLFLSPLKRIYLKSYWLLLDFYHKVKKLLNK